MPYLQGQGLSILTTFCKEAEYIMLPSNRILTKVRISNINSWYAHYQIDVLIWTKSGCVSFLAIQTRLNLYKVPVWIIHMIGRLSNFHVQISATNTSKLNALCKTHLQKKDTFTVAPAKEWNDLLTRISVREMPTLYIWTYICKLKNTKELMHCRCGTNNRAPRWTFTDPCK